jgi:SAM-dependent methyltransferase
MERGDFDESYKGTPPWDIGRPQREFINLETLGKLKGSILDAGCGTGENSIFFAARGHAVAGIDLSPRAIQKAREKAKERKIENVIFQVKDALRMPEALEKDNFDSAIDCGLFHTFSDIQRREFVKGLRFILQPGGKYFMLCFSDLEPPSWGGPRRVSKKEIHETFADGWEINYIHEARIETNIHQNGGNAWLSSITKLST